MINKMLAVVLMVSCTNCATTTSTPRAESVDRGMLVPLHSVAPTIQTAIRYAGSDNFVGQPVTGYDAPVCLLTAAAAAALAEAQGLLAAFGLELLVYDCYRPQRAVDHFMRWARDLDDRATKTRYYPRIAKASLVRDGYIAERSGHSRGSTVDLTLIGDAGPPLDMGTPWDFFDSSSHTAFPALTNEQRRNRLLLVSVMDRAGFENYAKEWWHFTLRDEPNPDVYLNQPVRQETCCASGISNRPPPVRSGIQPLR
jgi:D-alanyl-D-alanine dipeptidase